MSRSNLGRSGRAPRRQRGLRRRWATPVLIALATVLVLSGCAGAPSAILNVPGHYTADLWAPTPTYPEGHHPTDQILVCLGEASALRFALTYEGSPFGGYIAVLDWPGQPFLDSYGTELTTPILQPGCGTVSFGADCCFIPNHVRITVTKL